MARAINGSQPGRCVTTLLQLEMGRKDPAMAAAKDLVDTWVGIITGDQEDRTLAKESWPPLFLEMYHRPKQTRWLHV